MRERAFALLRRSRCSAISTLGFKRDRRSRATPTLGRPMSGVLGWGVATQATRMVTLAMSGTAGGFTVQTKGKGAKGTKVNGTLGSSSEVDEVRVSVADKPEFPGIGPVQGGRQGPVLADRPGAKGCQEKPVQIVVVQEHDEVGPLVAAECRGDVPNHALPQVFPVVNHFSEIKRQGDGNGAVGGFEVPEIFRHWHSP